MKKPIIKIEVNSWNKRSYKQQDKALEWLMDLVYTLETYRKTSVANDYQGWSEYTKQKKKPSK